MSINPMSVNPTSLNPGATAVSPNEAGPLSPKQVDKLNPRELLALSNGVQSLIDAIKATGSPLASEALPPATTLPRQSPV